ncbi:MAG: hypothetical protein GX595_19360, partial [Lentisphaerae bacterium]|nr:hypothetical protein [Lentisphaerota bacterium]
SLDLDAAGRLAVRYADGLSLQVTPAVQVEGGDQAGPLALAPPEAPHAEALPEPGLRWRQRDASRGVLVETTWRHRGALLESAVRLSHGGAAPLALRLELAIAGLPLSGRCFAPAQPAEADLNATGGAAWAYRGAAGLPPGLSPRGLVMPMVCVYEPSRDLGFTLAARLEAPTPAFAVAVQDGQAVLQRRVVVPPGGAVTLRQVVLRHEACWRPGLGWMRDAHPEVFMTSDAVVNATHGCFIYSNTGGEDLCEQLAREGVRNVEVHWNCPFFGKSVPEAEPWVRMLDDHWNTLKLTTDPAAPGPEAPCADIERYVRSVCTPAGRVETVRQFIRGLQRRGMAAFLYVNPTECWEVYATQEYPECIVRRPDGTARRTWFDHVVMDCRPDSRWGQHLIDEVEGLLRLFPEADGIFMDQSAGDPDDFRVCRITTALAEVVHRAGKTCYWNGPYMVDLLRHAVGLLGELGPVEGDRIAWLAIGNKVCCGLGHSETQYQRNLLNGLWPPAPSQTLSRRFRMSPLPATPGAIPEALARLHGAYLPLYASFLGKVWYLGARPLRVPEGVQANLFVSRSGDYLMPLVVPGHALDHGVARQGVAIAVRVPDAARLRAAWFWPVNFPGGRFAVPLCHADGEVCVDLPWLGSAGLLVLSADAGAGEAMPSASTVPGRAPGGPQPRRVACAVIRAEGFVPDGNRDSLRNGLVTTAPLPPVPVRRVLLNGLPVGDLESVNSPHWHPLAGVGILHGLTVDITPVLRRDNDLVIEPAWPGDFFKLRHIAMVVVFTDGLVVHSAVDRETYSSCAHPQAEGVIGSPLRIRLVFPDLPGPAGG